MGKTVSVMEENTDRVYECLQGLHHWNAIIVTEKAVKAIKIETINSCWRKLCPDAVYDFTGFMAEPIKEIMKEIVDIGGKKIYVLWGKGFKICILEKFKIK